MKSYSKVNEELKKDVIKSIIDLIDKHGKEGVLSLFDLCSEEGLTFGGDSTLDQIKVIGNDVLLVFNENENDSEPMSYKSTEDICKFHDDLVDLMEERVKVKITFSADIILEGKDSTDILEKFGKINLWSEEAKICEVGNLHISEFKDAEDEEYVSF